MEEGQLQAHGYHVRMINLQGFWRADSIDGAERKITPIMRLLLETLYHARDDGALSFEEVTSWAIHEANELHQFVKITESEIVSVIALFKDSKDYIKDRKEYIKQQRSQQDGNE